MARVRDTVLYKSIAPFVKSITKKQLQEELTKVRINGDGGVFPVTLNEERLTSAFIWYKTVQGYAFWRTLCTEIEHNKEKADESNH